MFVGTDHDTSAFAVQTLRRWWDTIGKTRYPDADRLLICADGGGSNGYRLRAWKTQLAALATETGLAITVCHLPPGDETHLMCPRTWARASNRKCSLCRGPGYADMGCGTAGQRW